MTTTTVARRKLTTLSTGDLIAQYNLAVSSYAGRCSNTAPRQKRISYICDLLLARAENGDTAADQWLAQA